MPGAVNVMPAGLGGVLAKRASREVKMEVRLLFSLTVMVVVAPYIFAFLLFGELIYDWIVGLLG